jgi:hypothetical protein
MFPPETVRGAKSKVIRDAADNEHRKPEEIFPAIGVSAVHLVSAAAARAKVRKTLSVLTSTAVGDGTS